jgi:hypothetical protein
LVRAAGPLLIIVPITQTKPTPIPPKDAAAASGLMTRLRKRGGAAGTANALTVLKKREQFHSNMIVVTPLRDVVRGRLTDDHLFPTQPDVFHVSLAVLKFRWFF